MDSANYLNQNSPTIFTEEAFFYSMPEWSLHMKTQVTLVLVACFGFAAGSLTGSSGKSATDSPINANSLTPRFVLQGDGEARVMFDSQTGETWVMKTVFELDPSPIVVWFPVPRASDSLTKALVAKRAEKWSRFHQDQHSSALKHQVEKEKELGAEYPGLLQMRKDLESSVTREVEFLKAVQSFFLK